MNTMEVILERAQCHVFVNQYPVMAIGAEADEVDDIRVAQRAQRQDTSKKLLVELL